MKLYVDLDKLEFIEGPGFRNPISNLRFKRGDAARLDVMFLANGSTPTTIGNPATLEIHFGAKLNGQYGTDYIVHSDVWTLPVPEATNPVYTCSPSFNTEALDAALGIGGTELSEVELMAEITWREGTGAPTSTGTVKVAVSNDVVRGSEGAPTPSISVEDWLDARAVRHDQPQIIGSAGLRQARSNILAIAIEEAVPVLSIYDPILDVQVPARRYLASEALPFSMAGIALAAWPVWANDTTHTWAVFAMAHPSDPDLVVWAMLDPTNADRHLFQGTSTAPVSAVSTTPWQDPFQVYYDIGTDEWGTLPGAPGVVTIYDFVTKIPLWDAKADAATTVQTSGNQTIAGDKLFIGGVSISGQLTTAAPKVSAYKNADQSLATGYNLVTFQAEVYDDQACFAGSTFTAPYACDVLVTCGLYLQGSANRDTIGIFKNGAEHKRLRVDYFYPDTIQGGSFVVRCAAGDTLDIRFYASGSDRVIVSGALITWVTFSVIP